MSGIAGIFHLDGRPADPALFHRMTEAMAHRGPDGAGNWTDGPVALGHRMLWTTPEALQEKQPLTDELGDLCLTLDGRVANREELRQALEAGGLHRPPGGGGGGGARRLSGALSPARGGAAAAASPSAGAPRGA